ncbi:FLYWCH-type domain-containing protein [Pseudomonas jessenii]
MNGVLIACNVNARLIRLGKYKKGGFGRPFLWPLPLHYRTQARQDLSENNRARRKNLSRSKACVI